MDGARGHERGRSGTWRAATMPALAAILLAVGPARAQPTSVWLYSARPGDTIGDLSRTHLTDWQRWPELQAINRIEDAKRIPPGWILRFLVDWLRAVPAEARPVAVEPPAQVRDAGQPAWQPLAVDRPLGDGAAVATGPDGSVTLRFADGSRMLVPGGTTIVLERLRRLDGTPLADSAFRLEQGRVVPTDVPSGSRMAVRSPPATTSVRGTSFRLALDQGAAELDTEVLTGCVTVAAQGRDRPVGGGFGTTTRAGEVPRAAVPLLPPPDVARIPPRVERVPFAVELGPLAGAVGYLRARAIEADGYEGAFSAPQRIDVVPTQWWPMVMVPLAMILLAL
jgi:hypothetical protein